MCDFKLIPFSTSYSYYKINEQLGILNRLIIDSLDEHTARYRKAGLQNHHVYKTQVKDKRNKEELIQKGFIIKKQ